jgi:hypothetical protein
MDNEETIEAKIEAGLREAHLEAELLGPYFRSLLGIVISSFSNPL